MPKKSFQTAPKPVSQVSQADIEAFEKGGVGKDKNTHTHITSNVCNKEILKRLSVDIPENTHTRFKTACSATGHKMTKEILDFIKQRTIELEKEAGLTIN
jgi:hypothetical protein